MQPPSGSPSRRGQLLTVSTAAQRDGVTPRTIGRWVESGRLPAKRQSGRWVIRTVDLVRACRASAPSADSHSGTRSNPASLRALVARLETLQVGAAAQRRATAALLATLEILRVEILVLREDLLGTTSSPLRSAALQRLLRDLEKSTAITGRDSIRLLNPVRAAAGKVALDCAEALSEQD